MALRGDTSQTVDLPEWLTEAVELYELVQITGWDPDTIDGVPGVVLDELRVVHGAYTRARARGREG
jgi:hypothetical protein